MKPGDIAAVMTWQMVHDLGDAITERELGSISPEAFAIPARELRALPLADRSMFHFSYARYLYARGEYRRAHARIRCAVRLCRAGSDHLLFARAKHLSGAICRNLGRVDEAAELFLEAFVSHKRARNDQGACLPLVSLGLLHLYAGDLAQARKVLSDALLYARRHGNTKKATDCAYDLFIAHMLSGNFAECRTALSEIRSGTLMMLDSALWARYSGQFSVWHLETEESRELLKRASTVFARERFQRDYVICLEYLGMNEYFAGNYAGAKEYYQQVLDMPEPTASAVAQTLRMLCDVHVAERDWKNAKETAAKAEQAITRINERIELAALWRAQGQIAEHDGNHDVARDFFRKSIDLLQQCGARYELALTHLAAGQSTLYSLTSCAEHLEKAKTLFVEMGVSKRVTQVLSALAKLEPPQLKHVRNNDSTGNPEIITQNPEMLRILAEVEKLAETEETVLITGETGVGKDLLANYIHQRSPRSSRRFLSVSCPNLSETLLESRLFGHRKGAFSGAIHDEEGFFKATEGGTLLLNEIGEVPDIIQSKLLEVIETKTMFRLGDSREYRVDVRLLAATNRDLQAQVCAGSFRRDLFYRLQDFHLHLPSLRERLDDLPLLVRYFLKQLDFADYDLRQSTLIVEQCDLVGYDWPGNVRELKGVLKKAVTLTPSRLLAELIARLAVRMDQSSLTSSVEAERAKLAAALEQNGGNKSAAARELDIPLTTLWNQLKRYGIS